jgi:RNA polymerase sigma-70 factor (ECF subfamily)
MDESEIELVRRAQAGDSSAFNRLAMIHEERLLAAILAVVGNRMDAYDAYQETLVRSFRSLRSFRFDSTLATWMTRIAIRQALNWRRRWKGDRFQTLGPGEDKHPDSTADAFSELEARDVRAALVEAMETLSDRERAVFTLKHEQNYRLREIALMLDCAEGTVKSYLFRAVRKLRTALPAELSTP